MHYCSVDRKSHEEWQLEMLVEVLSWGLGPSWVTGDSRYSGASNLKLIRHYQLGFLFALESNRLM